MSAANALRGEAALLVGDETLVLRPSFAALVAAEEELGPLFALVERAAAGGLRVAEMAALFWHCADPRPEGLTRERIGAAIADRGLAGATPALRLLLGQILQGRGAV
ncbi:MAG TPA: gene transfer agent family protein [Allosphingosinicella sp.]|nr:gene transfer agent family protein [Allosphingosinicella sp.]